jgi:hypothetical protein
MLSVMLLGCGNIARSHSRPQAMVADLGRYMVTHPGIAVHASAGLEEVLPGE